MIIIKTIDGVKYEAVLDGAIEAKGEGAKQYAVLVHDPEGKGGRLRGFLAAPDTEKTGHVNVATLALK